MQVGKFLALNDISVGWQAGYGKLLNGYPLKGNFYSGLARNRTWIWSFGNSYTIHCTTRPFTEVCKGILLSVYFQVLV